MSRYNLVGVKGCVYRGTVYMYMFMSQSRKGPPAVPNEPGAAFALDPEDAQLAVGPDVYPFCGERQ